MGVMLNAQEGEQAHKEMEKGKPAGRGKCTRVGSKRFTIQLRRSYFACKNKERKTYKRIDASA